MQFSIIWLLRARWLNDKCDNYQVAELRFDKRRDKEQHELLKATAIRFGEIWGRPPHLPETFVLKALAARLGDEAAAMLYRGPSDLIVLKTILGRNTSTKYGHGERLYERSMEREYISLSMVPRKLPEDCSWVSLLPCHCRALIWNSTGTFWLAKSANAKSLKTQPVRRQLQS